MAKQTTIDSTVLAGNATEAIDLSGYANACTFSATVEEVDVTTFDDLARRRIGSLKDAAFSINAFHDDGGDPWTTLTDMFATTGCHYAWIESNASMAEADRGAMLKALQSSVEGPGGQEVGTAQMVNVSGNADGQLILGQVLQQDESLSSSGNSTGFQFGALAAGETLVCKLWVLTATAGTIDVTIESDDNSGFTSATTRATFSQFSAVGAEEQTVSGAVTDDYWRAEYTIATGPFVIVVMIGKK